MFNKKLKEDVEFWKEHCENRTKKVTKLEEELKEVKKENRQIGYDYGRLKSNPTATAVIENILGEGIEWYDYKELDDNAQQQYYDKAVSILQSSVFENEVNVYISDLVQNIAMKSEDWQEVLNLRMSINGVKTLKERLEDIEKPTKSKAEKKDLNATI